MAKNKHDVGVVLAGRSPYGSHKEFIYRDDSIHLEPNEVLCKDERGIYKTTIDRIDNGLADSNRWSLNRKNYEPTIQK